MRKIIFFVLLCLSVISLATEFQPDATAFSVTSIALSPDGEKLLAGYIDNTVKVWNLQDGRLLMNLNLYSSWVTAVAITPDGKTGVAGFDDGMIKVWDLKTGKALKSMSSHTSAVNQLLISEDGKTLYSAGTGGTVKEWSLEKLAYIRSLRGHSGSVNAITLWPSNNRLYSVSSDGTLRIWDTSSAKQLKVIKTELGELTAVAMSPDRSTLIVGSREGVIKFYDVKSWEPIKSIRAHNAEVTELIIREDRFYTVSCDRTIKVLSFPSASLLKMITGHQWDVTSIVVSKDQNLIYSGSMDGTIKIWEADSGNTIGTLIGFGDGEYFSYNCDSNWVSSKLGSTRVKSTLGNTPRAEGEELECLTLQVEKLPRVYGQSLQYIGIDNNKIRFSVSKPVVKVTLDGAEFEIKVSGEVECELNDVGAHVVRAYDAFGNSVEKVFQVCFQETPMYAVKDTEPYKRGDKVLVAGMTETEFLINGEWHEKVHFSRTAPDTDPPKIEGRPVQLATLGEELKLEFAVSDNSSVRTIELIGPDSKVENFPPSPDDLQVVTVWGTGEYLVKVTDAEGNQSSETFNLRAIEEAFWVLQDQGTLRRGQKVTVTAQGENCFYVKEYGWLEKEFLTKTALATERPVVLGEAVQYAEIGGEKLLHFKVSDDVGVSEVRVSGKLYPIDLKEKEMLVLVSDYGEYEVVVTDAEGNSTSKTFELASLATSPIGFDWKWLLPAILIAAIASFGLFKRASNKKRKRKIRL